MLSQGGGVQVSFLLGKW